MLGSRVRAPGGAPGQFNRVQESMANRSLRYLRGRFSFLVSVSTVLVRIKRIADGIKTPQIKPHREYEVDEMWTFLGNKHKPLWIGYALDRKSKEVVAFNVGGRSIEMLSTIFKTVNRSAPAKVYTDYLVHYLSLVPCEVHVRGKRGTTHIERHNLNLRTHLKRLNRKTICFTRSTAILYAILKIYFWG